MLDELLKLKSLEPNLKIGLLLFAELVRPTIIRRKIQNVAKHNFYSIHTYFNHTDKEIVDFAHDHGLKVIVWTVNDRNTMENLISIGVDGIITDDIALANELLGR
jgi:glycerophosphoryl diester phosphodiesterase